MGFTALDGLPMGTRPGQLDAGIVLYLLTEKGMSAGEIEHLFYYDCGLKGLSGISNDVRDLLTNSDPRAKLALDQFFHRAMIALGLVGSVARLVEQLVRGGHAALRVDLALGQPVPVMGGREQA